MARTVKVTLTAEVGQYKRGIGEAEKATEDLGGAVSVVDEAVLKMSDDFDVAARHAKDLDAQIRDTETSMRALAQEFARTGDSRAMGAFSDQSRLLGSLKGLRKAMGDAGGDSAGGFLSTFSSKVGTGLRSMPVTPHMAAAVGAAAAATAPLLGSAIGGAIIGGIGIGGVVGGLALAGKDPRVAAAASGFADRFGDRLEQAGSAFVVPALLGLGQIEQALKRVDFEGILEDAARYVQPLAEGVSRAIESIGGGIENVMANAGPTVQAIADGIALIGDSIGDGFTLLSEHGESAGTALKVVFGIIDVGIDAVFVLVDQLMDLWEVFLDIGGDKLVNWWFEHTGRSMDEVGAKAVDLDAKTRETAEAMEIAARAARGERDALDELSKKMREQTDPAFALLEAQDKLRAAQQKSAEAIKEHGENSTEAKQATRDLATAALDLQGKVGALGATFDGKLTPELAATLKAAGLTADEIRGVEREMIDAKKAGDNYAQRYSADVKLFGHDKVQAELERLSVYQQALKKGTIPVGFHGPIKGPDGKFWAEGGWTGPGGKWDEAGIVHADEYVIKKSSRRTIEQRHPGLLDSMNETGRVPGYADGGLVSWPYRTTAGMTRVPSRAEVAAVVVPAGPDGGATGPWMERLLESRFGVNMISGYRPGSRTLSGNLSYHARNRAVDFPPIRAMAEFMYNNYKARLKEAITPYQEFNVHNGRSRVWTGAVWNQHNFAGGNAHNHFAMANGGVIGEPVAGVGLRSGSSYSFGERGPETVIPGIVSGAGGGTVIVSPVFTGPVGSQMELEGWLSASIDNLRRKGRI